MARVSSPPGLSLLPFELPATVTIAGKTYKTSTTLWKGDISLEFVMDEPFWYSKVNIFGKRDTNGVYHDTWTDANGNLINVLNENVNQDVMKIVLEDGIPISSMLTSSMILGNNIYANLDDGYDGMIARDTIYVTFTRDNDNIIVYLGTGDYIRHELITFVVDEQLPIESIADYLPSINKATTSIAPVYSIYNVPEITYTSLYDTINMALNTYGEESYAYADMDTTE